VSVPASSAVWRASIAPPTRKLVALALAECHNAETGRLNPSLQTLADMVGCTRGQAQRHVRDLLAERIFLVLANRLGGKPGTTPSYAPNFERLAELTPTDSTGAAPTDSASATPTGGMHAAPTDGAGAAPRPETGGADAEDGRHTRRGGVASTPQTGSAHATQTGRNRKGTGKEPTRAQAPAVERPDDVSEQTWNDWCALRKRKRANVDLTTLNGARAEAGKADMTLEAFLQVWCLRGYQGLQASWLKPEEKSHGKSNAFAGKDYGGGPGYVESFLEKDERLGRQRYEEAAGIRRAAPPIDADVIELAPPPALPF